jgi:peroxiredoxin
MSDLTIGSTAPGFDLTSVDGQSVSLAAMRGVPVLLNFFKSNCPWCQTALLRLAPVYARLKDVRMGVLGIAVGEDAATAARFASEKELIIPVLLDEGAVCRAFGVKRVPTFVLVDESGKIARVYEGATEQLTGIIELTLLAAAGHHELPEYSLVGNGCSPSGQ